MEKTCTTCGISQDMTEFCQNTKKRWARRGEESPGSNRCKSCEARSQKLRYYAAFHHGYGANASKNPVWLVVPIEQRRAFVAQFEHLLERQYAGSLDSYVETVFPGNSVQPSPFQAPVVDPDLVRVRAIHKAKKKLLNNEQCDIEEGFVYVMTNPRWPSHVKVGRAIDYEDRVNGFQTADPFRSYSIEYTLYFERRRVGEEQTKKFLRECNLQEGTTGEWFKTTVEIAIEVVEEMKKILEGGRDGRTISSRASGGGLPDNLEAEATSQGQCGLSG